MVDDLGLFILRINNVVHKDLKTLDSGVIIDQIGKKAPDLVAVKAKSGNVGHEEGEFLISGAGLFHLEDD